MQNYNTQKVFVVTALAMVEGTAGTKKVCLLFDPRAQASFMSATLA